MQYMRFITCIHNTMLESAVLNLSEEQNSFEDRLIEIPFYCFLYYLKRQVKMLQYTEGRKFPIKANCEILR